MPLLSTIKRGLTLAIALLAALPPASASTVATFNLKELWATKHIEQPVELTYTGGLKVRSNHRMLGPNGVAVDYQQLTNGNFLIITNLPASTSTLIFGGGVCDGTAHTIAVNNEQFYGLIKVGMILRYHTSLSACAGLTNDTNYFVKSISIDGNLQLYVTLAATPGGASLITGTGTGTVTLTTIGFLAADSGDVITQVAHGYVDGNNWKCNQKSGVGGVTCDGATSYYVINSTANTFQIATAVGGSAVPITSDGYGNSVIDWTWTLDSGVAASATTTNPVTSIINGSNYQITNGVTGFRTATVAGNLTPFNKSPIQGVQLADGSWVAATPNKIYTEDPNWGSGDLSAVGLHLTETLETSGYSFRYLEKGPLLVKVAVSYATARPAYHINATVYRASGTGFLNYTLSLYANSKVIVVGESVDTIHRWFLNPYPDLTDKPDVLRYRATSSNSAACGSNDAGYSVTYVGSSAASNIRVPTPAYLALTYAADKMAGQNCGSTTFKKMNSWFSVASSEAGWYSVWYKAAGSSSSPLIGMMTGHASQMLNSIDDTPAPFTSNSHFTTSAAAGGIENQIVLFNSPNLDTLMTYEWGLYVSTKADLAADGVQQDIQLQQNALFGMNLSKVAAAQLIASTAGAAQYLSQASLDAIAAKTKDGTLACGAPTCYSVALPNSGTTGNIITLWQTDSTAGVDAAVNASAIYTAYLAQVLTQGDGIRDADFAFSQGALNFIQNGGLLNASIVNVRATDAQKERDNYLLQFWGNLVWDNDFAAVDNDPGEGYGNANQVVEFIQARANLAASLSWHPVLATKVAQARASVLSSFNYTNAYGALKASTSYQSAAFSPILANAIALKIAGFLTFADYPQLKQNALMELNMLTPPEPRFGNVRKYFSNGDGGTYANGRMGLYASVYASTDATTAEQMAWGWASLNSTAYLSHETVVQPTVLAIDDTVTQTAPSLGSIQEVGGHSIHRHGFGTAYETALWFTSGDFYSDHRHEEAGQVSIYALSAPLSVDWNANLYYPQIPSAFYHDGPVLESDLVAAGITSWHMDSPPLGRAHSSSYPDEGGGVAQWGPATPFQFLAFSNCTRSRAYFTKTGDSTLWTRVVISCAPNAKYPIIYIRDSFVGTSSASEKTVSFPMMATGAVTAPWGSDTPTARLQATCSLTPTVLPSYGTTHTMTAGLQGFLFTGYVWPAYTFGSPTGGINWNFYTRSSGTTQSGMLGDWGHSCAEGREDAEFNTANGAGFTEKQHILRINDTAGGPFAFYFLPYRKGETPTRTVTSPSSDLHIVDTTGTTETSNLSDDGFSWDNGTAKLLIAFGLTTQTAYNITLSGAASEIYCATSTSCVWKVTGMIAGNPCVDLSAFGGTWYASASVTSPSTNKFCRYAPASDQPAVATINLSTTSGVRTNVSIQTTVAAGSMFVRFGSATEFVGSSACPGGVCTVTAVSPSGSQPTSLCFDGSGSVVCGGQTSQTVP